MHTHDIIVIGASAGGVEALSQLVSGLPAGMRAAVFIVLHIARQGTSMLPQILSGKGNLPAVHPADGDPIEHGMIYAAPNDRHLLVEEGRVVLSRGPRENGFRPAVDALFRTAAEAYGPRVVGVILTGLLDNGSAGLVRVKACGGKAVVQDPAEALFADMPRNALRAVQADYVLPLAQIPAVLAQLAADPVPAAADNPGHNAQPGPPDAIYTQAAGSVTGLACPECGGVLVAYQGGAAGDLLRFECHVGHRYSLHSMQEQHDRATEAALWAAVRALEESRSMARRLQQAARQANNDEAARAQAARAQQAEQHAETIRQILLGRT